MKLHKEYLIFGVLIALTIAYLILVENVFNQKFAIGGQDYRFSPFDIVLGLINITGFVLVAVSFFAWKRKRDTRLFIISVAFLLLTLKGILDLADNFFVGSYSYLGMLKQTLELLVLLAFLLALFKR